MTVGHKRELKSLLDWGKIHLKENGIDDYAISAEVLLGEVLDLDRSEMLLNPREQVDPSLIERYESFILRREKREPLQYIVGHVDFYNVKIKCDRRALIPRPETEILVEIVLEELDGVKLPRILDIGTGSGNIAVALAKNIDDAKIVGVDISQDALNLAGENASANKVEDRIDLIRMDVLDKKTIYELGDFDCVVSNPPYVAEYEKDLLQPEVIEFEPAEALFSTGDPLRFFKAIIESAPGVLNPNGLLAFEVSLGQAEIVKGLESKSFADIRSHKDLAGIERVVTGRMIKE